VVGCLPDLQNCDFKVGQNSQEATRPSVENQWDSISYLPHFLMLFMLGRLKYDRDH
jgi:hypothetical protein